MINMDNLMKSLTLMWQGMGAIFIVMAAISLIVFCLTKFSGKKKEQ